MALHLHLVRLGQAVRFMVCRDACHELQHVQPHGKMSEAMSGICVALHDVSVATATHRIIAWPGHNHHVWIGLGPFGKRLKSPPSGSSACVSPCPHVISLHTACLWPNKDFLSESRRCPLLHPPTESNWPRVAPGKRGLRKSFAGCS